MLILITEIGQFMIEAYIHAWPYLLVTIPIAVLVNVSGISKYINKTFNAKPVIAIFLATVVGAFSPFCSCGVIPIITALLIGGVPLAPVMSFWLASPSMDPEVFFLSVSQLGLDLAVWRLTGTFIMSLAGGYITHFLIKAKWIKDDIMKLQKANPVKWYLSPIKTLKKLIIAIRPHEPVPATGSLNNPQCSCTQEEAQPMIFESLQVNSNVEACSDSSCSTSSCGTDNSNNEPSLKQKVFNESKKAVIMILKFMTLAFFLEALIILYIPEEWIVNLLGRNNIFAIPASALIGIPLYTTNLTALGLMGGLLQQGMSPGAVLAFLIGGATTTVPAMAAVYGIVKIRVFVLYVGFALAAALLTGYMYQLFNYIF